MLTHRKPESQVNVLQNEVYLSGMRLTGNP